MSLPALASLPVALASLSARAEQSLQQAFAVLGDEAAAAFAGWPSERQAALQRVAAASDFVVQQGLRDPQMLLDLAASGELERSLGTGELRGQLAQALEECADEDELGRRLRRYRNRQQLRIIWRDISRQADLIDVSLGRVRFGLPRAFIKTVQSTFPDHGFHGMLIKRSARQFLRSPLRPLPMFRW